VIWEGPGVDVKYVGGYGFYKYHFLAEADGTAVQSYRAPGIAATVRPGVTTEYNEQRSFFSNEINVLSNYDGPVQFIAGLYAYQENFAQPIYQYFNNAPLAPLVPRVNSSLTPIGLVATPTHTALRSRKDRQ
jgi:iron complex outermembrane receptor protein